MEMDYNSSFESYDQFESYDPIEDNLFSSPLLAIGTEWGLYGVAKLLRGAGKSRLEKASTYNSAALKSKKKLKTGILHSKAKSYYNEYGALSHAASRIKGTGRIFGVLGWAQLGFDLVKGVGTMSSAFATSQEEIKAMRYKKLADQNMYFDTRAAYTQRQRALQVIHNSRLSLSPVLGNESNYLHY